MKTAWSQFGSSSCHFIGLPPLSPPSPPLLAGRPPGVCFETLSVCPPSIFSHLFCSPCCSIVDYRNKPSPRVPTVLVASTFKNESKSKTKQKQEEKRKKERRELGGDGVCGWLTPPCPVQSIGWFFNSKKGKQKTSLDQFFQGPRGIIGSIAK